MHNQGFCQLFLTVPGTSAPSTTHLTVSLYLCSSGSNARGQSRVLDGVLVSVVLEATDETKTSELLGGTEENSVSPMRGH